MKYLKTFLENKSEDNYLKSWAYEYAKNNHEGLNSYEDAVYELDYFFDNEYPKMKGYFKLYRVLQLDDINNLNKEELGDHYLHPDYITRLYEKPWYESIGIEFNDYEDIYLVEVMTKWEDVNWEQTIHHRLNFPREFEITLNESPKEITNIKKIDKNKIK